jgi:molybdenum cofactor cytidylyltransferase
VIVTGLVLAAGSSSRLGQPKQLLPFRGTTLLGATLDVARQCDFAQLLVTVGGSAAAVQLAVDFRETEVVDNPDFGTGCGSSISAAMARVDSASDGIALMLGDQPGVSKETVRRLIDEGGTSQVAVCRYADGRGHPFWFARSVFDDLRTLHGDKAVWKVLESGRYTVAEVGIESAVPIDVDTWADYEALLASNGVSP